MSKERELLQRWFDISEADDVLVSDFDLLMDETEAYLKQTAEN